MQRRVGLLQQRQQRAVGATDIHRAPHVRRVDQVGECRRPHRRTAAHAGAEFLRQPRVALQVIEEVHAERVMRLAVTGAHRGVESVTSRWATLILASLVAGPHRFSQLNAKIGGISEKMLSQNLRTMVRDGLVKRTVTPTVPPQVSTVTRRWARITVQLWGLVSWIGDHTNDILEAQVRHDAATIHP